MTTNGTPRERFRLIEFTNPRTESKSWRVSGIKRDGTRIRENYGADDGEKARNRQIELEIEYRNRQPDDTALKQTILSDRQLRLAEHVFPQLAEDAELTKAVAYWLEHGRKQPVVVECPRLGEAVEQFEKWLEGTTTLRDHTKRNLKTRVSMFAGMTPNHRISEITADTIEAFLNKRKGKVSDRTRGNDKRALSRFFRWCATKHEDKPRWIHVNPCATANFESAADQSAPEVLPVALCEKLMREAEAFKAGRLVPYVALCLFGGLRPFEAQRVTWEQINLTDGELRLESSQTKTGRGRTLELRPTIRHKSGTKKGPSTLLDWLTACKGREIYPANWLRDFRTLAETIGYGRATENNPKLKRWVPDILRHTAISHFLRLTGSYGDTAEQFGNSEAIIKSCYQGRVTSDDTKKFYAIRPNGKTAKRKAAK